MKHISPPTHAFYLLGAHTTHSPHQSIHSVVTPRAFWIHHPLSLLAPDSSRSNSRLHHIGSSIKRPRRIWEDHHQNHWWSHGTPSRSHDQKGESEVFVCKISSITVSFFVWAYCISMTEMASCERSEVEPCCGAKVQRLFELVCVHVWMGVVGALVRRRAAGLVKEFERVWYMYDILILQYQILY